MIQLAGEAAPGTHPTITVCHAPFVCVLSVDSLISSAIAIVITLAIGFGIAYRLSHGVPGKLQMIFEALLFYVRGLKNETVAKDSEFIIPIAATIGLYILVANWIDFFPLASPIHPANSDLNQTAAMAIVVILVVQWYSLRVLGVRGYLRRFTKPFELPWWARALYVPINIIEEVTKPITLSLRLFGNIFAGVLMVYLLGLLPYFIGSLPLVIWKLFDVFFVGTIQALIFMLLTIVYFGMAREGLEEEHHVAEVSRQSQMKPTEEAA
jgi:F-type H+-transporting ATPase subunit a